MKKRTLIAACLLAAMSAGAQSQVSTIHTLAAPQ